MRAAATVAGVALWSWNVDTDAITRDERAYDLWEVSKEVPQQAFRKSGTASTQRSCSLGSY
jgi:uncharacterized protein YbdZ (MbtH family)